MTDPVRSTERDSMAVFGQILVISLLNSTTVFAVRPMVTYRALELGAGAVEIGLIASSYALLSLFAALIIGRWTDRVGPARFMIAGAGLLVVSSLGAVWFDSILGLAMSQALLGLGQIMNLVSAQTFVANQTSRGKRDERFGHYTMVASVGQLIGPAAGGFIAGGSLAPTSGTAANLVPVFLFAAVSAAVALVLCANLIRQHAGGSADRTQAEGAGHLGAAVSVLRRPGIPQAVLASVAVILTVDLLVAYLPAYGEANGLPVQLVGLLLALRAGGSVVSRLIMGPLIRWLGRGELLMISMLVSGMAIAVLPLLVTPVALGVLMLVAGFGLGVGQPMTIAWVANRVPRQERGMALGVRLTGNRLGQLVLPSIFGTIAGAAGLAAMFAVLAAGLVGGALIVWRTEFDEPRPPIEGASA